MPRSAPPYETDLDNRWHLRELGRATALEWARWYAARLTAVGGATLLVDDNTVNIDGARRAGWHTILVESDHTAAMTALDAALTAHRV